MRNNIKYSASFIIIILALVFGGLVYAEDSTGKSTQPVACTMEAKLCPDGVTSVGRVGPNCEFKKCPGDNKDIKRENIKNKFQEIKNKIELNKEESQTKREDFKNEVNGIKDELKNKKEEGKNQLEQMVQSVKTKREEFKNEFELNKEQAKQKISETKATFKENLTKIKNENKKASAEKIVDIILGLNTKITDSLSDKINQIENVLVSVESRTTKGAENGLDVTSVKTKIDAAKVVITSAREAISVQSKKTYTISPVTDEVTLRAAMKNLRDTFTKDIKALREVVKGAHGAVKDAATTLAKIPKVNDVVVKDEIKVEDTTKVENTNTTTTTNSN